VPSGVAKLSVHELETGITVPAIGGVFGEDELTGLPQTVKRYFRAAIASGRALTLAARLEMHESIRIAGRWLPFRATEVLAPHRGFVWSASVARGLLVGFDQYASVLGAMRWKVKGLIPVVQADGPDVARSVIAHCVGGRQTPFVEVLQDAEESWTEVSLKSTLITILLDSLMVYDVAAAGVRREPRRCPWRTVPTCKKGGPHVHRTLANAPVHQPT
jgi:Family of unknown function (DUF6544)